MLLIIILSELYGYSNNLSPYWPATYYGPYHSSKSTYPQLICRAVDTLLTSIQDMGIDHGGTHILMAGQFLAGPYVIQLSVWKTNAPGYDNRQA